jgi:hypothetical protein
MLDELLKEFSKFPFKKFEKVLKDGAIVRIAIVGQGVSKHIQIDCYPKR